MQDSEVDDINHAKDMINIVAFYQEDNDHVLQRRFLRLHLYNLYTKHKRLVDLDKELLSIEIAVKPEPGTGIISADAYKKAARLQDLLIDIDAALKDFGTDLLQEVMDFQY
jgi:hypothetical protein